MTARNLAPVAPVDETVLPEGPFDVPIDRAGLTIPRLRVVPMDGEAYEVQSLNPDMILWEETAAKHRWQAATATAAPFKWLTFLAWAASRRTGVIDPGVTWESFAASTAQVTDATTARDTARPTAPAPGPG